MRLQHVYATWADESYIDSEDCKGAWRRLNRYNASRIAAGIRFIFHTTLRYLTGSSRSWRTASRKIHTWTAASASRYEIGAVGIASQPTWKCRGKGVVDFVQPYIEKFRKISRLRATPYNFQLFLFFILLLNIFLSRKTLETRPHEFPATDA